MAESEAGTSHPNLMCPLCLDILDHDILMACGHSFCNNCLREHNGTQKVIGNMTCPVCSKRRKLGSKRVEGLEPKINVKGLIEDIKEKHTQSESMDQATPCVQHNQSKEIFCDDCSIFVCAGCWANDHEGHGITSKKVFNKKIETKINGIHEQCKEKEAKINRQIRALEEEKQTVISHMENVRMKIKVESAKRMKVITTNKKSLLDQVASKEREYCDKLDIALTIHRRVIEDMTRAITMVRNDRQKCLVCMDLDNLLKQTIDGETAICVRENAQSARFEPADETLLALGRLNWGKGSGAGKSQQISGEKMRNAQSTAGMSKSSVKSNASSANVGKSENAPRGSVMQPSVGIPSSVTNKSMKIVRHVDLPECMMGMAMMSQKTVVVGYGYMGDGADCYPLSGRRSSHLGGEVGKVFDIAILTDGRSVASHLNTINVYNDDGSPAGIQYKCSGKTRLCSDFHDNIYVVNGNPAINIFKGADTKPQRVVRTGSHTPEQICVTKTGVMITSSPKCTSTPSTVMVHDREGHAGCPIKASDDDECMYAAVDSRDRVFVARVKKRSYETRLSVYTLEGTTLIQQRKFNELKLRRVIGSRYGDMSCYMVCLTPSMLAFANEKNLYFVAVPS